MPRIAIEEIIEKYGEVAKAIVDKAVGKAWGTVYNHAVYAERYLPKIPFEIKGFTEAPLFIFEIQIELFIKDFLFLEKEK